MGTGILVGRIAIGIEVVFSRAYGQPFVCLSLSCKQLLEGRPSLLWAWHLGGVAYVLAEGG